MDKPQTKFGISRLNGVGGVEDTIIWCDVLKNYKFKEA